jgi:hypothetical protein
MDTRSEYSFENISCLGFEIFDKCYIYPLLSKNCIKVLIKIINKSRKRIEKCLFPNHHNAIVSGGNWHCRP